MIQPVQADSVLTVHIDNDVIFGTDRQYTGGFKFKFTEDHLAINNSLVSPVQHLINDLDMTLAFDQVEVSVEAYTLTKLNGANKVTHILNEAWTHVDLRRFYKRKGQSIGLGFVFGWLGPDSPGKPMQNELHQLIGNGAVKESLYALPNQATFQIGLDVSTDWFLVDDWQFYKTAWIKLGSPITEVYAGLGVIRSVHSHPVLMNNQINHVQPNTKGFGYFYFGSIGLSNLVYSALLDGRVLSHDKTYFERYRWVPMLQYGVGVSYEDIAVTLSGNAIGQVYKEQPENVFRFASATVSWFF